MLTREGPAQNQKKRSPHLQSLSSSQKIKCEIQWCTVNLSLFLCNSSKTNILLEKECKLSTNCRDGLLIIMMEDEDRGRLLDNASEVESDEGDPLLASSPSNPPKGCLTRHVFALLSFMGFANVYAMRVNLSVAIVAMVNNTAIAHNKSGDNSSSCPVVGNITEIASDGPFDWGEREQGWLLGAFFYGYVATQIPGGRMAEKYGGKMLYRVGVLITAVFTLLTPLAANTSIYFLVFVRIIAGLGEGVTFPTFL